MQPEEFPDIKQIKQEKKKKNIPVTGKSRSKGTQAEGNTATSQDNGAGG